jgi:hypothetical protein
MAPLLWTAAPLSIGMFLFAFTLLPTRGVPDFESADGRLTAESLATILQEVTTSLKEFDIKIIGIVGDNASAVQAGIRDVAVIQIRCLAHTLNPIYKRAIDQTDGELKTAWTSAMKVYAESVGAPRLIETRWNYKFQWMETVVEQIFGEVEIADRRKYNVSILSQAECRKLKDAKEVFECLAKHIDLVQADSATFVTAIRAISELHNTYAISSQRLNGDMRQEIYQALVTAPN